MSKYLKFVFLVLVVFVFGISVTGGIFIYGESGPWFSRLPVWIMASVFLWAVLLVAAAVWYLDELDRS